MKHTRLTHQFTLYLGFSLYRSPTCGLDEEVVVGEVVWSVLWYASSEVTWECVHCLYEIHRWSLAVVENSHGCCMVLLCIYSSS